MTTTRIASIALACAALAACADQPLEPGDGTPEPLFVGPDPCASAPADSTVDLPDGFLLGWRWPAPPVIVTSGTGFYGYPWNGRTCLSWVVDFQVHPHTNKVWSDAVQAWVGFAISGYAEAWDLPSSGADQMTPATAVDQQRWILSVSWYMRSSVDPDFTKMGSYSKSPSGSTGQVPGNDGYILAQPDEGAPPMVYRAVVAWKQRTSLQEVRVRLDDATPR
jgi:hypothetical protein